MVTGGVAGGVAGGDAAMEYSEGGGVAPGSQARGGAGGGASKRVVTSFSSHRTGVFCTTSEVHTF